MKTYFLFSLNFILILSQKINPKKLNSYEYSHFNLNENNEYIIYSFENKYSNGDLVFNIYKIESQSIPQFYIYTNLTNIKRNEETKEFVNYSIKNAIDKNEYEYIIEKSSSLISNKYFYIVLNIKNNEFKGDIIIFNENDITLINDNSNNICRRYKSVYNNNLLIFKTENLKSDKKLKISFINQFRSAVFTTFTLFKDEIILIKKVEHIYFGEYNLDKSSIYTINIQSNNENPGHEIDFNLCIDISNNGFEEIKNDDKNIMKSFIQSNTFYFFHNINNLSINNYVSFILSFEYYSKSDFYHNCFISCFKDDLMSEKLDCDFIKDQKKLYYYIVYQKKENINNIFFTIKCNQEKTITNLNRFSIFKEKSPNEIIDDYKSNFTNPYTPIYFLLNLNQFKTNNYQLLLLSNVENSISIYDGNILSHSLDMKKIEELSYSFILINPDEIKQKYSSFSHFTIEFYSKNIEHLYLEFKFIKTNNQKLYYNSYKHRKKIRYPFDFPYCYYEIFLINRYESNNYNNYLYYEKPKNGNFSILYSEKLNNISSIDDILKGKNFNELNKIVKLTSNIDIIKLNCNSILDKQNHLDLFFFSTEKEYNNTLSSLSFNRYYIEEKNNLLLYFDEKIINEEIILEISVLNSKIDNFQKVKIITDSKEYYLNKNNTFIRINHKNKFSNTLNIEAIEGNVLISILISDVNKTFQIQKHGLNKLINPNNYYLFIYKKEEMKETKSCLLKIYSDSRITTCFYIYKGFKKYPLIPLPSEDFRYEKIQIDNFNPFEINLINNNYYYNDYSDEDSFISLYSINGTFHYDFLFEKDFGIMKENLTFEINYEDIAQYTIKNDINDLYIFYFIYTCKTPFTFSFYNDQGISIVNNSINNVFFFNSLKFDNYITAKFTNCNGIFQYFKFNESYKFDFDVNLTFTYKFIDDKNIQLYFDNLFINEDIEYYIILSNDSSLELRNICLFKYPTNNSFVNYSHFIINSKNKTIIKQIYFDTEIYKNIKPYINIFAKEKEHYQIMMFYNPIRIIYDKKEFKKTLVIIFILIIISLIVFLIILKCKKKQKKNVDNEKHPIYQFNLGKKLITEKDYYQSNNIIVPNKSNINFDTPSINNLSENPYPVKEYS